MMVTLFDDNFIILRGRGVHKIPNIGYYHCAKKCNFLLRFFFVNVTKSAENFITVFFEAIFHHFHLQALAVAHSF